MALAAYEAPVVDALGKICVANKENKTLLDNQTLALILLAAQAIRKAGAF